MLIYTRIIELTTEVCLSTERYEWWFILPS